MKQILGLAGPYCAGKTLAAEILTAGGYREIDVDALGHVAREVLADEVREKLGTADRSELRDLVFGNPEKLKILESILHPWMVDKVSREVAVLRADGGRGVVNAALLFPMGLHTLCDAVVWVDAPLLLRYLRARKRDGISLGQFFQRVRSQKKLYPQKDQEVVDIITIANTGSRRRLKRRLEKLM